MHHVLTATRGHNGNRHFPEGATRARDSPANRILMRSSGCSIRVETTPPEIPATKYSYLKLFRTLSWRDVPGVLLPFIADMFLADMLSRRSLLFVTDLSSAVIDSTSLPTLATRACTLRHISWSAAGTVVGLS